MKDSTAPGFEFRGVTKRYGGPNSPLVVQGVDIVVPKGQLATILGPSGCGKTTLLRMLAGLEPPSSGSIFIAGQDVTTLGAAERNVSMVFQSYALFPHMSVLDNVAYGLDVSGVPKPQARERARDALASVGLAGYDARLPAELSGGQQQRVAVARALVLEPGVMLFDEPLSNLDAKLRRSMREDIRALQQRLGLTVAYVTHDQGEALAVSDLIIVMEAGRVAQAGSPRQLYQQPASRFVASFMGEALLLPAQGLGGGELQLGPLRLRLRLGDTVAVPQGPLTLAVRPEAWQLQPADAPGPPGLPATVLRCAYLGAVLELTLATALGEIFVVAPAGTEAEPGTAVQLVLTGQGVALLETGA